MNTSRFYPHPAARLMLGGDGAPADASLERVLAGECRVVTGTGRLLLTVVGSCVAACIRNRRSSVGGINHYMLPTGQDDWLGSSNGLRYGNLAMDALVGKILRRGGSEADLEVKLFGGGDAYQSQSPVGRSNVEFALSYLARRGIEPVAVDVGGPAARKIVYEPTTGRVFRQIIPFGPRTKTEPMAFASRQGNNG